MSYCNEPPCQNIVSSLQSHSEIPTQFNPFEGTLVLKWDRTTRKSLMLIEVDKNTNCALLNCWHWTGWIRQRILTTGDRLEGTADRPCHWGPAWDSLRPIRRRKKSWFHLLSRLTHTWKKRTFKLWDILMWSLLMYYKVICTLRYINSKIKET